MYTCEIYGGSPLMGSIKVQRSKNAALPILAATVLIRGIITLKNCPKIQDVAEMIQLLEYIGCTVHRQGRYVTIDASTIGAKPLDGAYTRRTRASILLLGSLLGRTGESIQSMPGGCAIGKRPIDFHLKAFEKMGARIEETNDQVTAKAVKLHGAKIRLPFPSVGATENILLAAVCAEGTTILENAAREPEIVELAMFLNGCGAQIHGAGKQNIKVQGVHSLHESVYEIGPDRIVAGTCLMAAAMTRGEVTLKEARPSDLSLPIELLKKMGAEIICGQDWIFINAAKINRPISYVKTAPYPGFPTDLQSQLVALLATVDGESCVEETVFENRFHAAFELNKMGAHTSVTDGVVHINGVSSLQGAELEAGDLRSAAALVIAGMAASGRTVLNHAEYLLRGYENIVEDFNSLSANVRLENK